MKEAYRWRVQAPATSPDGGVWTEEGERDPQASLLLRGFEELEESEGKGNISLLDESSGIRRRQKEPNHLGALRQAFKAEQSRRRKQFRRTFVTVSLAVVMAGVCFLLLRLLTPKSKRHQLRSDGDDIVSTGSLFYDLGFLDYTNMPLSGQSYDDVYALRRPAAKVVSRRRARTLPADLDNYMDQIYGPAPNIGPLPSGTSEDDSRQVVSTRSS